tara:strand:- start:2497 stop:2898 length:402 start_codon:yes stop_codon:yes gene_type:complete
MSNYLYNTDICNYCNKMEQILNNDIIKKILSIININIIKKQKKLKYKLNEEIIEYKDLYYKDKNYIIFRNKFDDLVLKKKNIYIDYKYNFLKLANYNEKSSNIILHNNIINNSNIIMSNLSNSSNFKIVVKYL